MRRHKSSIITREHPPLDLKGMFDAIGFWTRVCDGEENENLPSRYNGDWKIRLIKDVTREPNTFELVWAEPHYVETLVLLVAPSTYDMLHLVDEYVMYYFFLVNGRSNGYVYFDVDFEYPRVEDGMLHMAAQFRKTLDENECRVVGRDAKIPCSAEFYCKHVCKAHEEEYPCCCQEELPRMMEFRGGDERLVKKCKF
jgi:hypothetical protein